MHNGVVDPFAKPILLQGRTTGRATAVGQASKQPYRPPPPNPPAGRPTFIVAQGKARANGHVSKVKELRGQAAGVAVADARPAMVWYLTGLAQGMAIAAHMWPAEFECIVLDYGLPVLTTEIPQRILYLCTRHRDIRATGERPTLVEYIGLIGPTPCDDCNPWYFASWEVIPADDVAQPVLLDETA